MDSIDPNLNDTDFALSYLNVQGVKIGVAYNFTDSLVGAVTYYHVVATRPRHHRRRGHRRRTPGQCEDRRMCSRWT